ncbi:LexA-binding, inner membrane-associated putative hydrolase [uncultured archaeon]|nr:LexA-binding, inner membrane-associated putative hydrolase [uncultured archaeon]
MDWKSHLLIGLSSGALAAALVFHAAAQEAFLFAIASGASSLLPDLDMRKSKASSVLSAAVFALIIGAALFLSYSQGRGTEGFFLFAALLFLAALALDLLLRPRHRGIMHSLAFLALLSSISLLLFGGFFACAAAVGYFSHLASDFCIKPA